MELEARHDGDTVTYNGRTMLRARGGDGTEPPAEPTSPEATAAEPPADPPPAASTEAPSFDTPFRLEEVPEDVRPHVERYINSTRPAVTKAFQTAAEQRQAAEEALQLSERLGSPDTALEALQTILSTYGLELSDEDWALAQGLDGNEPPEGGEHAPEWARRLEQRFEAEDAAAEEAEAEEAREQLRAHVNTALAARAEQHGYGESHTDLPEPIRNAIAAFAAVLPPGQDGLPNVQAAQENFDAAVALEVNRIIKSKTPPEVPPGGGPGERRVDVKDAKDRYALAEEIANRHFTGSTA